MPPFTPGSLDPDHVHAGANGSVQSVPSAPEGKHTSPVARFLEALEFPKDVVDAVCSLGVYAVSTPEEV